MELPSLKTHLGSLGRLGCPFPSGVSFGVPWYTFAAGGQEGTEDRKAQWTWNEKPGLKYQVCLVLGSWQNLCEL